MDVSGTKAPGPLLDSDCVEQEQPLENVEPATSRKGKEMDLRCVSDCDVANSRSTESRISAILPWSSEHRFISLLLLFGFVVLAIGPMYYLTGATRRELADKYRAKAHGLENGETCYTCQNDPGRQHKATALNIDRAYANEVMFGGLNGLLLMVTTVLGGIGADLPSHGIMAIGAANLVAYGSSLGLGTYVVQLAQDEFSTNQLTEEHEEVQAMPEQEINEMVCFYQSRGMSEADARTIASTMSKYEDYWVEHMMKEELGVDLPKGRNAAAASGLATSLSFIGFGTVPLLGVIVSFGLGRIKGPQWYRPQFSTMVALALSASAAALLGVFLSWVVGSRAHLANGVMLLGLGCLAAVLALGVGEACKDFGPKAKKQQPPQSPASRERTLSFNAALESPTRLDGNAVPRRLSTRGSGLSDSPSNSAVTAWPSFRKQFLFGLCALWVIVASLLTIPQLVERAGYQSMRVFAYGWLTCITTGLGALPFAFVEPDSVSEKAMALANAGASGMMLAASAGMLLEAHEHCGSGDWQIFAGLAAGCVFIKFSEWLHGDDDGDEGVEVLHAAIVEQRHFRKALLIFTVMFFHSAAEGIAVGVAFSKQLREQFGLYVSLLLAVHNIPEGLTVALVLVPRGVSTAQASGIAVLTSVPQPLLAMVAYLFVDSFTWLLPLGLSFAAGAMVYVCFHELLTEAAEQLGLQQAFFATATSFVTMSAIQYGLQALTGL